MMTTPQKMTVELPPTLAAELSGVQDELIFNLLQRGLRDLHIEQALERYQQGGISFGAAAEIAGISQSELARSAYVRNIEPPYDEKMVAEELA